MLDVAFVFSTCAAAVSSDHFSSLIVHIFKYFPKMSKNCENITALGRQNTSKFFNENLVCCYCHELTSFLAITIKKVPKFFLCQIHSTLLHKSQSVFCFMLIHVQLQLPAARAQTKTSYSLFNKLAKEYSIFGHKLIVLPELNRNRSQ